jgi:hypothetical protein
VISWILPQREITKADNRMEDFYPSERWVRARFPGEDFNILLRKHLVDELEKEKIRAVAPMISPRWKIEMSAKYGMASRWSGRHAAYANKNLVLTAMAVDCAKLMCHAKRHTLKRWCCYFAQLSIFKLGMRMNSFSLLVIRVLLIESE